MNAPAFTKHAIEKSNTFDLNNVEIVFKENKIIKNTILSSLLQCFEMKIIIFMSRTTPIYFRERRKIVACKLISMNG